LLSDDLRANPDISVTDEVDSADATVISDGLRAYYLSQTGYYDFRPLAVLVRDPQTGKVVGGLHGRSEFGLVYVAWFFLPEDLRRARIGSRVLAMAEEEGRRRGCTRIALTTLSIEAPGFYQKQGYAVRGDDRLRAARPHALLHDEEALRHLARYRSVREALCDRTPNGSCRATTRLDSRLSGRLNRADSGRSR
jgi:GNAT superfamily N-acetyltransferase